jgi:hypothetical protein
MMQYAFWRCDALVAYSMDGCKKTAPCAAARASPEFFPLSWARWSAAAPRWLPDLHDLVFVVHELDVNRTLAFAFPLQRFTFPTLPGLWQVIFSK